MVILLFIPKGLVLQSLISAFIFLPPLVLFFKWIFLSMVRLDMRTMIFCDAKTVIQNKSIENWIRSNDILLMSIFLFIALVYSYKVTDTWLQTITSSWRENYTNINFLVFLCVNLFYSKRYCSYKHSFENEIHFLY